MIYAIARPLAKIALGIYFRKIYLINMGDVPKDKPVMLAANHPTAFIEPVILACWLDQPISFLARGDLYQNSPIVRRLYDWFNITPIFRREDTGYSNLTSNYETFEKCYERFESKMPLVILSEGRTLHEKRLRPIRKGTARIVLGSFEKHGDLDIHLVPVCVNYTDSDTFRSVVMIEFAEPIHISEYQYTFQNHPAKAVNQITKELTRRLKNKIIHINDPADDMWVDMYLTLKEYEFQEKIYPVSSPKMELLDAQKKITEKINSLNENEKKELKINVEDYFQQLNKNGITDFGLMHRNYASLKNTLFVILAFLPAMVGYLSNAAPIRIGTDIANKMAPSIEFRAAMGIFFSMGFYLVYGLLLYIIGFAFGFGWWTFSLVLIPILGYFYIYYRHVKERWSAGTKAKKLKNDTLERLLKEREGLMGYFD